MLNAIANDDVLNNIDSDDAQTYHVAVEFNPARIAAALGVPREDLLGRMFKALSRAVIADALEMAVEEMRASGRVFAVDGFPEGWPDAHVAAVTLQRLFPEMLQ